MTTANKCYDNVGYFKMMLYRVYNRYLVYTSLNLLLFEKLQNLNLKS